LKSHISPEQLLELSPQAQAKLAHWLAENDSDRESLHVFIPEEVDGESSGVFEGMWDDPQEFVYPQNYEGKLRRHKGTILPLMDVTLLWWFMEDHGLPHPQQSVDELWAATKAILEGQV
jgi:hypothetical protein